MIRVEFLGPIGKSPIEIEARTLQDVADFLKKDISLVEWLPKCAVAINDTMVSGLEEPLKSGDKVTLLPPVCGG